MTKFGIVKAASRSYATIEAASFADALRAAQLTPGAIDFGTVTKPSAERAGLAIVVPELGLFVPPSAQSYFSINRRLYGGNAVLYGFDLTGATVDLPALTLAVQWLDAEGAERAIRAGSVIRPVIGSGDDIIWRWPEPRPSEAERDAMLRRLMARSDTLVFDNDTTITVEKKG